ncbi:MAG TPA: tetratricopeptide repeat protein [Rectinemataceae bacterium]|nr:tetratricopeptide repeat protein [Rectinemataceae bacterium]
MSWAGSACRNRLGSCSLLLAVGLLFLTSGEIRISAQGSGQGGVTGSAPSGATGAPAAGGAAVGPDAAPQFSGDARSIFAQAEGLRFSEDWYGAVEAYLAVLDRNPSYGEALYGLAECYYELEQYDQALLYARRAAPFLRGNTELADLEGFIRIGLTDLPGARSVFSGVTATRPNDIDARFGMALLDLAAGKKTEARLKLEDSLRLSPQNARALLSLAVIASDQGRPADAEAFIERALRYHGSEPRTQYVAARLSADRGDLTDAVFHARTALDLKPDYAAARLLLGSLMYDSGSYDQAIALMRDAVARNRKDGLAWYTLGMAQVGAGRTTDALYSLKTAVALRPDDEMVRIALEDAVVDGTTVEDSSRDGYAQWHFQRGADFEDRSYFDQALFEYRRGLVINPYSVPGRLRYANLLKERGFPGKYFDELGFIKDNGKPTQDILDAIEIYDSLLSDSVGRSWSVDENALPKRPYKLALFFEPQAGGRIHTADEDLLLRYLKELLAASTRVSVVSLPARVGSLSEAFRRAREAEADYFVILKSQENEREIALQCELRVARTGSPAASFSAYRTGNDRVKNALSRIVDLLGSSLPPYGSLLKRSQDRVLVDLGRADGLKEGDKLTVLKQGSAQVKPEGLGLSYPPSAAIGEVTLTRVGEEASEGSLKSAGFFDTVNLGDRLVIAAPVSTKAGTTGGTPGAAGSPTPGSPGQAVATPSVPEPTFPGLFMLVRSLR